MKKMIITLIAFSSMAHAKISLEYQTQKNFCVIDKDKISLDQSFDNGSLKAHIERPISLSGLDQVAHLAAKSSRGVHADDNKYFVNINNERSVLNTADSAEAKTLVRMLSKLCN